ncbi:MAG TPA: cytochrome C oxidase subunit IV family protein [Longimicrobium sp.]|jgi:cytochrome c oxidase subunit 4
MSSEQREIAHDQHTHPGPKQYVIIGIILTIMTVFEILAYYAEEDWGILNAGMAAAVIAILSAAKFITVVMYYMHLKFDSKIFTGIFIFPAALAILVIGAMYIVQQVLPRAGAALGS